jgi:hypothetical protein
MNKTQLGIVISATLLSAAWGQQPAIPVKGFVAASLIAPTDKSAAIQTVSVLLRLYDRQFGGTLLYQERQTVAVEADGIFVAMVGAGTTAGVPARITSTYSTVWADYSLASTPGNISNRQEITHSSGATSNLVPDGGQMVSLCFTCGGNWPNFSGSFTNTGTGPTERAGSCTGTLIVRTDSRPFLCSR